MLLCRLREKYWIFSARRKIRSVLSNCSICKRYSVRRMEAPSPPLPIERVRDASVFEVTGVDLAGPLYLKGNVKVWICLYTCAFYRAVHLELLFSLSTQSFLEGFRRFIARRGRPAVVFSDNGTNFVGAENSLKSLDWEKIAKDSAAKRIDWRFNPPTAAWWGGWWERLIRIVKDLLRKILGRASINHEQMITILCDCEALINSRPLTYVSSDSSDLMTLTPNMFLQGIREIGVPDIDFIDTVNISEKSRYLQKLKDNLRRRFRAEYLGQLRENLKKLEKRELKIGDLVLIGSEDQKRIDWPLARIKNAFVGRDGCTRVCRVKTQLGELTRPVQRIYPLELDFPIINTTDKVASGAISDKISKIRKSKAIDKNNQSTEPIKAISEAVSQHVTRSGRKVKAVDKYTS